MSTETPEQVEYVPLPVQAIPGEVRDYYKASAEMAETQTDIAEAQYDRSNALWKNFQDNYLPHEKTWAKQMFSGIPAQPSVDQASVDARRAAQQASGAVRENMRTMGIDPSSGRYQQKETEGALAASAAETGARGQARAFVRDYNQSMKAKAIGLGRGIVPQAQAGSAQALEGITQAAKTGSLGTGQFNQAWETSGRAAQTAAQAQNQWNMDVAELLLETTQAPQWLQDLTALGVAGATTAGLMYQGSPSIGTQNTGTPSTGTATPAQGGWPSTTNTSPGGPLYS